MPAQPTPRQPSRKVAPGILERHARACAYLTGRRRCTCRPTFRAEVQHTADGATTRATRTFPTLEEARDWREAAKLDLARHGTITPPPRRRAAPSLQDAVSDFLSRAEDGKALTRARRPYSQATVDSYETTFRLHVLSHVDARTSERLADLPVDAIDARTIQAMIDAVAVAKSAAVARVADASMSAVMADLYARGILDAMPARRMLPPPPRGRDRRLTLDEVDRLLTAARAYDAERGSPLIEPLLALLAGGGLRIREALELVWGPGGLDLDADHPRVTVARDSTKTDAGARVIGLDTTTAAILERHRLAGAQPADGQLVFAREDGAALDRGGRVRSAMRAVADAAGVEHGFHLLRHTHGSLLADAGVGGHDIAARLGHRDSGFTARTYVHAADDVSAAPDALDDYRRRQARKARKRREGA